MIELIKTPTQTILIDVVGDFGLTATAEQTKSAVEDGSVRSDHKIIQPSTLEIACAQTETPIEGKESGGDPDFELTDIEYDVAEVATRVLSPFLLAGGAITAGVGAIAGAIMGGPPAMQTLQTSNPRDRGGELTDALGLLFAGDEVAAVTYKGRTYTDMSLVGLVVSYTAEGEVGLTRYQLSFEELKTAKLQTVALPDPEELAHKAEAALGKKKAAVAAGKKTAEQVPEPNVSLLRSLI